MAHTDAADGSTVMMGTYDTPADDETDGRYAGPSTAASVGGSEKLKTCVPAATVNVLVLIGAGS